MTEEEAIELYDGMNEDLSKFARIICDDVITDDLPDFHREIYQLVSTEPRLAMAAPRGFAKSTITSKVYPLWLALFKKRKDICIISASEGLAVEHLRYIKQALEANQLLLSLWGSLKSEKWSETHIIIQHPDGTRINIRAKGAGGQLRGFRPDVVILDDIETDEGVESEEQRKKLKQWLFKACINTLLPGGQFLIIGTLIHPLSVLSDLLETPNGWMKRKYTAYIDGIEDEEHILWAARSHEWLQGRKKEIGSFAFASEYMNDPRSDESVPIKSKHIRYWEELPTQLSLCITVDPAYSEDANADFKVASVIGIDQNHNRYLVDYVRTHAPSGEFIDAILNLYIRHKGQITGIGVPNSGTEKEFFRSVTNRAGERNLYPPFIELKNAFTSSTGGTIRKKKRRIIAALQPLFEQGKYYIHANHNEARDELLTIGSSRWDDVVDTMAYGEQILTHKFYFEETPNVEYQSDYTSAPRKNAAYGIQY